MLNLFKFLEELQKETNQTIETSQTSEASQILETSQTSETSQMLETNQTTIDVLKNLKTFLIIAVIVFLFILTILLVCYILKRNNEFLGLILSFLIGIAGFFGLFSAKEPEERKKFFFGWVIGYSLRILYAIGFFLGLILI